MKIELKSLSGKREEVDVDPSITVAEFKQFLQDKDSTKYQKDLLKLIFSGKIFADDKTIESYGVKEGSKIVVMTMKKKAAPAATATTTTAPAPVAAAAPVIPQTPAVQAPQTQAPAAPQRAGPEISAEAVSGLVSMGFPEAEVRAALRAAWGNQQRAVEFLTTGIPDSARQQLEAPTAAAPTTTAPTTAAPTAGDVQGLFATLRNHPQFQMMQQAARANPAVIPQIIERLVEAQPALGNMIRANQDAFVEFLSGGGDSSQGGLGADIPQEAGEGGGIDALMAMLQALPPPARDQLAQQLGFSGPQFNGLINAIKDLPSHAVQQFATILAHPEALLGGGAAGGAPGGAPGGRVAISLTPAENEAIERLCQLGFDRNDAIQAYMACDKNEELAANLLFQGM